MQWYSSMHILRLQGVLVTIASHFLNFPPQSPTCNGIPECTSFPFIEFFSRLQVIHRAPFLIYLAVFSRQPSTGPPFFSLHWLFLFASHGSAAVFVCFGSFLGAFTSARLFFARKTGLLARFSCLSCTCPAQSQPLTHLKNNLCWRTLGASHLKFRV